MFVGNLAGAEGYVLLQYFKWTNLVVLFHLAKQDNLQLLTKACKFARVSAIIVLF